MVALPNGEKNFLEMYNILDRIPAYDGQMGGRTDVLPRHSPRYAYVLHGKNCRSSDLKKV